jgi:hypothetical protein
MKWLIVVAGWVASVGAMAEDLLPKQLSGNISRPPRYVVSWSITVDSQQANGAINGKFTFEGRSCPFTDLAFTGSYRDGILKLSVPAANPDCGPWDLTLKRNTASGFEFDGTAIMDAVANSYTAFLKGK